jgi:hypothetical protein
MAAIGIGALATNRVADAPIRDFTAAMTGDRSDRTLELNGVAHDSQRTRSGEPARPESMLTPASFGWFSGAEQEAVLDLIEEDAMEQGSLSI